MESTSFSTPFPSVSKEPNSFILSKEIDQAVFIVRRAIAEVVKIAVASTFLVFLSAHALRNKDKMAFRKIIVVTVVAPLMEEIIFRGVLLHSIWLAQKVWNTMRGTKTLSEEDQKFQEIFRVHLSAFIFGLAHLTNPRKTVTPAIIQCAWTYMGGVAYAYLLEKHHTLAWSILAHGLNNTIAMAAAVYDAQFAPVLLVAICANKICAYTLAVTDIGAKISQAAYQALGTSVVLIGRVANIEFKNYPNPMLSVEQEMA